MASISINEAEGPTFPMALLDRLMGKQFKHAFVLLLEQYRKKILSNAAHNFETTF